MAIPNSLGPDTLRAMNENARQSFWNGSQPPFGYTNFEAERRGTRSKKRLAIDEDEAAVARRIFAYLRLFVRKIIVATKEIRITGPTAAIERAASAEGQSAPGGLVPSFVRDWCAICDESANWEVMVSL